MDWKSSTSGELTNDIFLVPDIERLGKKIGVSKFILQISIRELHNCLISKGVIYQLKESIDKTTGKPLTSDTVMHALMSNYLH